MKKQNYSIISLVTILLILLFISSCALSCGKPKAKKVPELSTSQISDIGPRSAKCAGSIMSDGGSVITACGFCWNTSGTPTIADRRTAEGRGSGSFTSVLKSLQPNTTYHVRAYATNSVGTGYGKTLSFTTTKGSEETEKTFTDSRDGRVYKTVKIGNQVWMAENLKYLPSVYSSDVGSEQPSFKTKPCYYVYGYEGTNVSEAKATKNYQVYGVLYNWFAALEACPEGWHLPTDAEWTQLTDYLGGEYEAGGKLKEKETLHWRSPNTDATNSTGFTALPAGNRGEYGNFYDLGNYAYWWSATESSDTDACYRVLFCNLGEVYEGHYKKEDGFSVRCVKDDE